jgi:hypothetical protein
LHFFFRWRWRVEAQLLRERSMHHQEKQNRFSIRHLPVLVWTTALF